MSVKKSIIVSNTFATNIDLRVRDENPLSSRLSFGGDVGHNGNASPFFKSVAPDVPHALPSTSARNDSSTAVDPDHSSALKVSYPPAANSERA